MVALAADWHTSFFADDDVGEQLAREALRAPSASDVPAAIELSYWTLATARFRRAPPAEALELLAEAHRSLDEVGAPPADHARLLNLSSLFHLALGDFEAARRAADASLAVTRATGSPLVLSDALTFVGRAWFSEDAEHALAAFEESIALVEVDAMNSVALAGAAQLRARSGDRVAALSHLRTAIANDHDIGFRSGIAFTMERAIAIFASLRDDELAATCAGIVKPKSSVLSVPFPKSTALRHASPSAWDRMTTRLRSPAAPHLPTKRSRPSSSPRSTTSSRPPTPLHPAIASEPNVREHDLEVTADNYDLGDRFTVDLNWRLHETMLLGARVSTRIPKCLGRLLITRHDHVKAPGPLLPEPTLAFRDEVASYPTTTVGREHRQAVHRTSPTIPGSNDHPDELAVLDRNNQRLLVPGKKRRDSGEVIGG